MKLKLLLKMLLIGIILDLMLTLGRLQLRKQQMSPTLGIFADS